MRTVPEKRAAIAARRGTSRAAPASDAPWPEAARRIGQAGFTLLEVLAGLAVCGLILAGLASGIQFGQQAIRAQARSNIVVNDLAAVDSMLRSLVASAWPGGTGAQNGGFAGTARTLTLRTRLPDSVIEQSWPSGTGPLSRGSHVRTRDAVVALGVDGSHRLFLTWLPWYRSWIGAEPAGRRIDLLDGVERVEFAYWDPSLRLPPGGWVTAWVGETPPRLARIRLVFQKESHLRWPDIIVAAERERLTF